MLYDGLSSNLAAADLGTVASRRDHEKTPTKLQTTWGHGSW